MKNGMLCQIFSSPKKSKIKEKWLLMMKKMLKKIKTEKLNKNGIINKVKKKRKKVKNLMKKKMKMIGKVMRMKKAKMKMNDLLKIYKYVYF